MFLAMQDFSRSIHKPMVKDLCFCMIIKKFFFYLLSQVGPWIIKNMNILKKRKHLFEFFIDCCSSLHEI